MTWHTHMGQIQHEFQDINEPGPIRWKPETQDQEREEA